MTFHLFLMSNLTWADPFILELSEEINLEIGGNWSIPIVVDDEWKIALAQDGDLFVAPLEEGTWFIPFDEAISLTGRNDLSDHSLRRCPDGSWLHVASSIPSNFIYRYDDEFQLQAEGLLEQGSIPHASNDVPAICGSHFQGFGVAEQTGVRDYFFDVDTNASLSSPTELSDSPRMTGSGLLDDEIWEELLVVGVDPGPGLVTSSYNLDLNLQQRWMIPLPDPELVMYWPSGFIRVGDYFLVATMGRNPAENWDADTGDVYLFVLDESFDLIESHQVTRADPFIEGYMRPWISRKDDTLLIGFDQQNSIYIAHATLNLEEFGVGSENEDNEDTNDPWNGEENNTDSQAPNTGCRDKSQSLWFPFLFFPLLRDRNRPGQAKSNFV